MPNLIATDYDGELLLSNWENKDTLETFCSQIGMVFVDLIEGELYEYDMEVEIENSNHDLVSSFLED